MSCLLLARFLWHNESASKTEIYRTYITSEALRGVLWRFAGTSTTSSLLSLALLSGCLDEPKFFAKNFFSFSAY